jgi:hypothetical protein
MQHQLQQQPCPSAQSAPSHPHRQVLLLVVAAQMHKLPLLTPVWPHWTQQQQQQRKQ